MVSPELLVWLKHSIGIYLLTIIQEDAAITVAGFSYVEKGLPILFAYIPVYFGLISGDFLLYGLGRMAQKNRWLRSKIIGPKVERIKTWLDKHLVSVLITCRFIPLGLLFSTFVACGWFKIPFRRFAMVSIFFGAAYSFTLLMLIILFGSLVLSQVGGWAWLIFPAVVGVYILRKYLKSRVALLNDQEKKPVTPLLLKTINPEVRLAKQSFSGMPLPLENKNVVSFVEGIPNKLFHIPLICSWLVQAIRFRSLTLPSVSNPMIEAGGFMGESKSSVMDMVGEENRSWLAEYVTLEHSGTDIESEIEKIHILMKQKGLTFPVVVKPDIGSNGFGVNLIEDSDQLQNYIERFPSGAKLILQRPIMDDGEAGIFYVRYPDDDKAQIYSVTLRYFPFVVGDGKSTLKELIKTDQRTKMRAPFYLGEESTHRGFSKEDLDYIPIRGELIRLSFIGSLRNGGFYSDGSNLITPELTQAFDKIARSIPEFYYGRFDIKFESTHLLREGKGFRIIEINGADAETIRMWDPKVTLFQLYLEFFKAQNLLFRIGACNRKHGFKPMTATKFIKAIRKQKLLNKKYPPSG
jgi:membrane protein DedA with SNARE-associated domain